MAVRRRFLARSAHPHADVAEGSRDVRVVVVSQPEVCELATQRRMRVGEIVRIGPPDRGARFGPGLPACRGAEDVDGAGESLVRPGDVVTRDGSEPGGPASGLLA